MFEKIGIKNILNEIKISLILGLSLAVAVSVGIHLFMGQLRQTANDPTVLETSLAASRYLNSSAVGGTATVLALILNLLSMSYSTDFKLSKSFYLQIQGIAIIAALTLFLGVGGLLFTSFPVVDSDKLPQNFLSEVYWLFISVETFIVGLLFTEVFILLQTVWKMIDSIMPSYNDSNSNKKSQD